MRCISIPRVGSQKVRVNAVIARESQRPRQSPCRIAASPSAPRNGICFNKMFSMHEVIEKLLPRLLTVALLLGAQSPYAGTDAAKQIPESSTATSKSEPAMAAGDGDSQPPAAVEVAPVSVPVSDAVQAAADLMRPSGATLDQVVAAMVRLNPAVFKHGDLQHVTFSRPLTIPSTEEILREDPGGLALFLLQLDIVRAITPLTGFADTTASLQALMQKHDEAAVPVETMQETKQEMITAPQIPAAEDSGEGSVISSRDAMIGAAGVALLLLMWILLRFGMNRNSPPLSTSSSVRSMGSERLRTAGKSPYAADAKQQWLDDLPDLPVEYLNYDDIEVLLQRVVAESPDAPRQVLQLMRIYQLRQDRDNFMRQHQGLVSSGFYQRQAEARGVINRGAVELGLKLDTATASDASENRIQQLEARVESAEKARKAAEQRASKAERVASDVELKLKEMQLQLDFGEMESH